MKCPKCDTENREGRKFCAECGAKLGWKCSECGFENEADERFCGGCGTRLVEADAITNLGNISGIFKAAFTYEGLTQSQARESVKRKIQNKWNQLKLKESKDLIRDKYEASIKVLE